jgi:long-chain fatty acid transport protein
MKKIVAFLTISFPLLLQAQGFQVNLQGQKQQGMGGTGTALVQDGASLFFNPGAASFLKDNSINLGVSPVIAHSNYTDSASSAVSETKSPVSFPFAGYAVFGKKYSTLKYGLAVYTPFGSTIDWQNDWTGRFVLTHLQLSTVFFQPTVSYKISNKIGIGAGFVYGLGKMNLQRDIPVTDNNGNYGHATLEGNGQGFGFNAGIYYEPSSILSFGFNYRSQVNMKVDKGNASFTVPPSLASNFPSGNFNTSLPLPEVFTFGVAYAPVKRLKLALDISRIGWGSFDTLTILFQNKSAYLTDTRSPREYKDVYSYRLGGQYSINGRLDLRAGLKYLTTPVPDGYVSPDVPDATHFNYSAGIGYKFNKNLVADFSFIFEKMKRSGINYESQLNGTYNTNLFIPGVSVTYNF